MAYGVLALVLLAAAFHATWNIIVKGGSNKLFEAAFNTLGGGLGALVFLPFLGWPPRDCWFLLALSICFHMLYSLSMAHTYRAADLTLGYPIMRGTAPILTAIVLTFFGAPMSPYGWGGVLLLCAGIFTLAFRAKPAETLTGVLLALRTSVFICAYTLADGYGARAAGESLVYTAWLFVFNMIPLNVWCLGKYRTEFLVYAKERICIGILGGFCGLASYGIAIWAMTVAPIALVAALRETSVIFGMIMAVIFLGEKLTPARIAAICLVCAGAMLARLG